MKAWTLLIRPGILLSGLFLFTYLKYISANDLVPGEILSGFFLDKPDYLLSDSNRIFDFSFSYSPLLKEKRRSDEDRFNSFLNFMDISGKISLGNSKVQSITSYRYDSYCGAVRIDDARYGSFSSQKVHRVSSLLWYSVRRMRFGIQAGSIIPLSDQITIADNSITGYLKSGLFEYGLMSRIDSKNMKVLLYIDKSPLHYGYTRLELNRQPDHFRSFPLLFTDQSIGASTEVKTGNITNRSEVSISKVKNNNDAASKMQMPVELNLNIYKLKYEGKTAGNLAWSVNLLKGGGFCSGYSNSYDGFNYFLADTLRINSLFASMGIKDSLHHTILLEGGVMSMQSPGGFLDLAPFSQWSVFYPVAYRYDDCRLLYFETGFNVSKLLQVNRLSLDMQLRTHIYSTSGSSSLSKKEIIILFPYYRDMGEKKFWNENGILFLPQIAFLYNKPVADCKMIFSWIVPLQFHEKKPAGGQSSGPQSGKMTGGLKAALNLSIKKSKR